jgi:hypothetical protein
MLYIIFVSDTVPIVTTAVGGYFREVVVVKVALQMMMVCFNIQGSGDPLEDGGTVPGGGVGRTADDLDRRRI